MTSDRQKVFPAKVLLFGEYTVLQNGDALAIPTSLFSGHWTDAPSADTTLVQWCQYLKKNLPAYIQNLLDLDQFNEDILNGLNYNSSIPIGYGLGSSGSLTAALFYRYGLNETVLPERNLQYILGSIESFFHGKSSGLDPLVSYLKMPIHMHDQTPSVIHNTENITNALKKVFLLDTHIPRTTSKLVQVYLNKCKSTKYLQKINKHLVPLNKSAIKSFITNDEKSSISSFRDISSFQFEYFTEMIPDVVLEMWKKGLESGHYFIKLCGAGGGGCMLVYSKSPDIMFSSSPLPIKALTS